MAAPLIVGTATCVGRSGLLADPGLANRRPQDQGMNPSVLATVDDQAKATFAGLRSVLVVRRGYLLGPSVRDRIGRQGRAGPFSFRLTPPLRR